MEIEVGKYNSTLQIDFSKQESKQEGVDDNSTVSKPKRRNNAFGKTNIKDESKENTNNHQDKDALSFIVERDGTFAFISFYIISQSIKIDLLIKYLLHRYNANS